MRKELQYRPQTNLLSGRESGRESVWCERAGLIRGGCLTYVSEDTVTSYQKNLNVIADEAVTAITVVFQTTPSQTIPCHDVSTKIPVSA